MDEDEAVDSVLLDLFEHFADLDDDEDAPFGEWARVSQSEDGTLRVMHETEPWGIVITIQKFRDDR